MVINGIAVLEQGLSIKESLVLLHIIYGSDIGNTLQSLYDKGLITSTDYEHGINFTEKGNEVVSAITKETVESKDSRFVKLAEKMKELYPTGRKEGTSYMWRGNTNEIVKKLKTLKDKYSFEFTDEQALIATKEYVESFNGDYRFMQLLKYFVLKAVRDGDGNVEIKSELMTRIENAGQEEAARQDWMTTLV